MCFFINCFNAKLYWNISKKIRKIKDKEFFSYKGFNLINVYFSVKYSACIFTRDALRGIPCLTTGSVSFFSW